MKKYRITRKCPDCLGSGKWFEYPAPDTQLNCKKCKGTGKVKEVIEVEEIL